MKCLECTLMNCGFRAASLLPTDAPTEQNDLQTISLERMQIDSNNYELTAPQHAGNYRNLGASFLIPIVYRIFLVLLFGESYVYFQSPSKLVASLISLF